MNMFMMPLETIIFCFLMFSQTLHRMYIVNAGPGFKKVLWPAAQKFLDAKTIAKIHVMDIYILPLNT